MIFSIQKEIYRCSTKAIFPADIVKDILGYLDSMLF